MKSADSTLLCSLDIISWALAGTGRFPLRQHLTTLQRTFIEPKADASRRLTHCTPARDCTRSVDYITSIRASAVSTPHVGSRPSTSGDDDTLLAANPYNCALKVEEM